MAEQVRVVVDAMGGDNAPAEPVRAAVEAVTERQDIKVILTGKQEVIDKELAKYSGYPKNQIPELRHRRDRAFAFLIIVFRYATFQIPQFRI